ncbi:MAG: hypothetical protein ACI4JY_04700 [Oscillospiraceae bacterium]
MKILFCILAVAAVALSVTGCQKEETTSSGKFSTTSSNSDRADFRSEAIISKKNYVDMATSLHSPTLQRLAMLLTKLSRWIKLPILQARALLKR